MRLARTHLGWLLEGAAIFRHDDGPAWLAYDLAQCVDLDLGFTPATNLIPIRRLALTNGQARDVRAAWLDVSTGSLTPLEQRYERRADSSYWYEAPRFGYAAELDVAPSGFVRRYPALWEAEVDAVT